jgi:ribonucleoside-diphosphate reductase alpha chain
VSIGDKLSGFAFCNLTEINAAKFKTVEDFRIAARAASIIGTLQAAYTDFPYLGVVSEEIARRDALLGVSMTGMLDSPEIACNPDVQREMALHVIEVNAELACKLGINAAARTTAVKPAGTTSLAFGGTASGHHAHHARRYFRRVTANPMEPVFQYFLMHNEHMCVRKKNGDYVIEFLIEAPQGAIVKDNLSAVDFLEMVKSTQINWVISGTARPEVSPGLTHNVSNTVHVHEEEWTEVADYLFANQQYFTGVSLLPAFADKAYAFAPNEAITTVADEKRWNHIAEKYKAVDYHSMIELEDGTALKSEAACAGGACAIL